MEAVGGRETREALATAVAARAIVLVEGTSDRNALEALAARRGRLLDREGAAVVQIGGAHALGSVLLWLREHAAGATVLGLCDAGEEASFRSGLERAGHGAALDRRGMERLGFFVCVDDLEDELIRGAGPDSVLGILDQQGDLGSFRTLQKEPEWRGRPVEQQLRRFLGSGGGRKIRYARLLVDALDLELVPRPLDAILARLSTA